MTDPVPSKERATPRTNAVVCEFESKNPPYKELVTADFARQLERELAVAVEILATNEKYIEGEWFNRVTYKQQARNAQEENARLRTALTGIQSCSTCEACRGAATRVLYPDPVTAFEKLAEALPAGFQFPTMEPNNEPLTHLEILSAVHHHANEIVRLTATVPVQCSPQPSRAMTDAEWVETFRVLGGSSQPPGDG